MWLVISQEIQLPAFQELLLSLHKWGLQVYSRSYTGAGDLAEISLLPSSPPPSGLLLYLLFYHMCKDVL